MATKETVADAMLVVSVQRWTDSTRDATCPYRSPGDGVEVKRYAGKKELMQFRRRRGVDIRKWVTGCSAHELRLGTI
jgi:hypothetical protein